MGRVPRQQHDRNVRFPPPAPVPLLAGRRTTLNCNPVPRFNGAVNFDRDILNWVVSNLTRTNRMCVRYMAVSSRPGHKLLAPQVPQK